MSGGFGGRGGSFARRGSTSKKVKHRKQDFHEHRIRLAEEGGPQDLESLKERTLLSLDKLGHQLLPADSSYGMQSWTKSLAVLLDDFEARASAIVTLEQAYFQAKASVLATLSNGFSFPEMDAAISAAMDEVAAITSKIGNRDAAYFGSRFAALKTERERLVVERDAERAAISRVKAERPGRLFQRILGQKPPSTSEMEAHEAELGRKIDRGDALAEALRREELQFEESKREQAAASDRLAKLESIRTERLQLAPEREEATKRLSDEISKILPPP